MNGADPKDGGFPSRERFLADVAGHRMEVLRDDGDYRHARFASATGHRWVHWFDLVTWPGCLAIRGDCGSYVFACQADMFEFFRSMRAWTLDFRYWLEKAAAQDRNAAVRWSPDLFRAAVEEKLAAIEAEAAERVAEESGDGDEDEDEGGAPDPPPAPARNEPLRAAVEAEVLALADEGPAFAVRAALDFEWAPQYAGLRRGDPLWEESFDPRRRGVLRPFEDFWERDFREYTPGFVWCCRAVAWGIARWDEARAAAAEGVAR